MAARAKAEHKPLGLVDQCKNAGRRKFIIGRRCSRHHTRRRILPSAYGKATEATTAVRSNCPRSTLAIVLYGCQSDMRRIDRQIGVAVALFRSHSLLDCSGSAGEMVLYAVVASISIFARGTRLLYRVSRPSLRCDIVPAMCVGGGGD